MGSEATRPAGGAARADEHDRDAAARTVRDATLLLDVVVAADPTFGE